MKKLLILTASAASFIAAMQPFHGFSMFWKEWISLPLLRFLSGFGSIFPFVLLEALAISMILLLLFSLFRRCFFRSLRRVLIVFLSMYLCVWYPLYFGTQVAYKADTAQLSALCIRLIDELNAVPPDAEIPSDLPAKISAFPVWMRCLNISGFASFFTGEAIVSPETDAASLPFVAVHEQMHLMGVANEGAANIAAWHDCMARGGTYAASARLWALRYAMGRLYYADFSRYFALEQRMSAEILRIYRACGGAILPAGDSPLLKLPGIGDAYFNYEILADYLAVRQGECYNEAINS